MNVTPEPSLEIIKQIQGDLRTQYMQGGIAAQRLGITSHLLSRITGTIYVKQSSDELEEGTMLNVGLNLKFNKKNEEVSRIEMIELLFECAPNEHALLQVPGYTRKENNQWLYSPKAVELIRSYMIKCPELFERLHQNVGNDIFKEEDLFKKG